MSPVQLYVFCGLGGYFLILLYIGYTAGKSETNEGFVIGARDVGVIPTMGSLAASFRDGGGVLTWIAFGFTSGYGGLWLMFGATMALIIVAIFGPRVRALAKERNYITVGHMIRDSIGPYTATMLSAVIVVLCLMSVTLQLYVSGNLLAKIAGVPEVTGVVTTAVIVGFYLVSGGYGSVVKTDALQFFLILSLIVSPLFFTPRWEDVADVGTLFSLDNSQSIAFFFIGFLFVLGSADAWQRLFSARNDKVIRVAFPLAGPALIIMTVSLFFLGMAAKTVLDDPGDDILFALYSSGKVAPQILAFIAVVVIAITMSTLDTFSYLFSSTILEDFMKIDYATERKKYIRRSRVIMLCLLASMSVAAINVTDGIKFLFDSVSAAYIMVPVFVFAGFGFFKPNKVFDRAVALSVTACLVFYSYMFFGDKYSSTLATLQPGALSFVLVLLSMLLFNYEPVLKKLAPKQAENSAANTSENQ